MGYIVHFKRRCFNEQDIRNEAFLIHTDDVGCTTACEYLKSAVAENHQVHNDGSVNAPRTLIAILR